MSTVFSKKVTFRSVPGASYIVKAQLTGPTSYTNGGVPVTPGLFNFTLLDALWITGYVSASTGSPPLPAYGEVRWDFKTNTIFFMSDLDVEVAQGTDVSNVVIEVIALGRG